MRIDLHAAKPAQRHIQMFGQSQGAPVSWRLLSGNNREIGRGVQTFADPATCSAAVRQLQARVSELQSRVGRIQNVWTWSIALDGRVLARSQSRFDRQIRCRQSLTQFLSEFADSAIGANVMWTQSRRWVLANTRTIATGPDTRISALA